MAKGKISKGLSDVRIELTELKNKLDEVVSSQEWNLTQSKRDKLVGMLQLLKTGINEIVKIEEIILKINAIRQSLKTKGELDGIKNYVIPAIKRIKNHEDYKVVFKDLSKKLNVRESTVRAECTTVIGLKTKEFIEKINNNEIADYLIRIKPKYKDIIAKELK